MAELLGGAEDDHLVIRAATLSSPTEETKDNERARPTSERVINREERCSVSSRTKHAKTTKKRRNFQQDM